MIEIAITVFVVLLFGEYIEFVHHAIDVPRLDVVTMPINEL